jgi:hypothetical protein
MLCQLAPEAARGKQFRERTFATQYVSRPPLMSGRRAARRDFGNARRTPPTPFVGFSAIKVGAAYKVGVSRSCDNHHVEDFAAYFDVTAMSNSFVPSFTSRMSFDAMLYRAGK